MGNRKFSDPDLFNRAALYKTKTKQYGNAYQNLKNRGYDSDQIAQAKWAIREAENKPQRRSNNIALLPTLFEEVALNKPNSQIYKKAYVALRRHNYTPGQINMATEAIQQASQADKPKKKELSPKEIIQLKTNEELLQIIATDEYGEDETSQDAFDELLNREYSVKEIIDLLDEQKNMSISA